MIASLGEPCEPGQQRVLLFLAWHPAAGPSLPAPCLPAPSLSRDQPCLQRGAALAKLRAGRHAQYHLSTWQRRQFFQETILLRKFCYPADAFLAELPALCTLSPLGSLKSRCGGTALLCDGLQPGWASPEAQGTRRGSLLFRAPAYPGRSLRPSDGADGSSGGKSPEPVPSRVWFWWGSGGPMEDSRPWLSGAGCVLCLV